MDYLIDRGALDISTADIISESLYANDNTSLQKAIKEYIFKTISFYDKNIEGFHHGLVLGLVAIIDNRYNIKSNRESGKGRYGVCLKPKIALIQVSLLKLNIRYDWTGKTCRYCVNTDRWKTLLWWIETAECLQHHKAEYCLQW